MYIYVCMLTTYDVIMWLCVIMNDVLADEPTYGLT